MTDIPLRSDEAERLRAFERRRHDELANSYAGFLTPVTRHAIDPLLRAARLVSGQTLLDVATGPGSVAGAAADRGLLACGTDLSSAMVTIARALHPSIPFEVADAEHVPYPNGSFDAVICSFGLGHFPYPEAVIAECARVVVPGGWIAVSWWSDPGRMRLQGLFREAIAEVGVKPPSDVPTGTSMLRFCDSMALQALLAGAGLSEIVVQDHELVHLVPDGDALWRGGLGSFALTASSIAYQDEDTQQAIRAALLRRAEAYSTADGLTLPVAFKIAAGRKPVANDHVSSNDN